MLDAKRRLVIRGFETLEGYRSIIHGWPSGFARVIARPTLLEPEPAWCDALMHRVYQVQACAVAVDELAGLASEDQSGGWLNVVQQRGRELGITSIFGTQRPRRIPVTVLSEADHVLAFGLTYPADRRFMAEMLGAYWTPADEHGFLYWRPGMTEPAESEPLEVRRR